MINYVEQTLSYTTVPVASRLPLLCIFTNLEVQGRYLPIIRGTGTSGDSTPRPGGAQAPKSWIGPKFSRTLDTLWSIDSQKK